MIKTYLENRLLLVVIDTVESARLESISLNMIMIPVLVLFSMCGCVYSFGHACA